VIDPAARARLEWWKLSLLDLSAGNRLLDAKESRTCIALPELDPVRLAATLDGGGAFAFEAGVDHVDPGPGVDTGRLRVALTTAELERSLVAIRRTARAQLADGGVHTMWLALGMLVWCDSNQASHAAPLALWPVELERTQGGALRLVAMEGMEPRFNQTLGEKLRRDFELLLAPADSDTIDLAALLDAAEGIAVTRPGWRVERSARLGIFSFAKFVMWNDLDTRADELLGSPVVSHLATGSGIAFGQPSGAAAAGVTRQIGASTWAAGKSIELLAPLDADASQLHAVAAAGAGASFVLQGPPGTGKSQTIANLIVHCVGQGKSVLFVTDKIAALEVVQQRLSAVGLGEFCLELHSHKAGRAQVLAQLGRVLERAFRPGSGPIGDDRLADLRTALDEHVAALHRVGAFGRSLHDVLGRLVELRTTPRASLAERDAVGLNSATFERRRIAVEQLAAAAVSVEPVANHPWRASTLERWPLDGRERALTAIDEAAASAAALNAAARDVASLVPGLVARTREQLQALGALAALAASSPRPGAELLTQLRPSRGDDLGEQIALIRARGAGTIDVPRDPLAFLLLASRHRLLATEVDDRFSDAVSGLDAPALWTQMRKWTNSVAPVRFVALRNARAEIKAAAIPMQLETDGAMISALEAVIAERACRVALQGAAEPARRWFGDLGGDPLALEISKIDAAVGWASDLRKAFDAVDVIGGDAGRDAAWRSLVAQVAAGPTTSAGNGRSEGLPPPLPPGDRRCQAPAGLPPDLAIFGRLAEAVARWVPALAALAEATGIDRTALGAGDDHLAALRERAETLRHSIDSLRDWVAFHGARHAALASGVGPAVAVLERGDLGASELALAWERATLLAWADAELADTPALSRFHGAAHHAHVAAFADLDRAALALVRSRALARLAERVPRVSHGRDSGADPGGELGVLLHELKKQRGHRPLRRLFAEIPTLLPRVAPCMLMSPLSVAQYLDPAAARFDIVVFDEASQLPTADAIGALARGEAAIVVGDSRQLPPTRFFEAGVATDEDGVTAELESVLDDCVAARLPELRLAWHYRSRHEDLIAFSNARYYGDRLQVFPTAQGSPDLGVSWRRIDGIYDRGATRQNRAEAEAVVAEVLARLRDPASRVGSRSIAVVTFSRAQQELVEDLLDEARDADPALDPFFEDAEPEPVIVKNLETIQGDERDVVLLSVGYGPDEAGAISMNFGPLSQRGGERRLNVAITRAREQLVVFSSFAPEDIPDDAPLAVRDLAALVTFARNGGGAARSTEDTPPASPITAAIARALGERGWTLRHQVGCGAYKVDLAVVDPSDGGRYVLAIEHDGAAYANAPAARDRDRLRAQVLSQLGWRLHRVWSLDWWADPEREIQRAHGAIVMAIAAGRQRRASISPRPSGRLARPSDQIRNAALGSAPVGAPIIRIPPKPVPDLSAAFDAPVEPIDGSSTTPNLASGSTPVRLPRNAIAIGPYTAAAIPPGRRTPDDLFAPRHLAELGKVVEQILAAEAPMHVDLLARRVGAYFGIGRVTQRVTDQVRIALDGRGRWGDEQNVVWRLDQDPGAVPPVRVASSGVNASTARREIDEIPLSELAAAARIVVERAIGIASNDLVRDTARLLGFARITEKVTERVANGVRLAQVRELIRIDSGKATLPAD
jgi:very-short-patch-repair endonuclease